MMFNISKESKADLNLIWNSTEAGALFGAAKLFFGAHVISQVNRCPGANQFTICAIGAIQMFGIFQICKGVSKMLEVKPKIQRDDRMAEAVDRSLVFNQDHRRIQ